MADTLLTLTDKVEYLLGDSTNTIWSAAEIKRFINEGYRQLLALAHPMWTYDHLNTVADTATYTLPADCHEIDRVAHDWGRIDYLTPDDIRRFSGRYKSETGKPVVYILGEDGTTKIRLWPIPSTTATEDQDDNNTRVEYYQRATTLTDESPSFIIPDSMIMVIRHYAMWKCLERKGKGQARKLAEIYKQMWEDGVYRIRRRREKAQMRRIGVIGATARRPSTIPGPRLPWRYGKVIRYWWMR